MSGTNSLTDWTSWNRRRI